MEYKYLKIVPIDENVNVPFYDDYKLDEYCILSQFTGNKKKVVKLLLQGESFNYCASKLNINQKKIYKIKKELKMDLKWVYDEKIKKEYLKNNKTDLDILVKQVVAMSRKLTLSKWAKFYVNDYNPEAQYNSWNEIPLQDVYYNIWENNPKSCIKAPREHLKSTSACEYIVKKLFEKKYPLDIILLHKSKDIAIEKLRIIQSIIERCPILSQVLRIDKAKNWKDGEMRFLDNSSVYANAYGVSLVGRHPHFIILDDIIDQEVVYSDIKNDKAIRKFYSDIYPMITDATVENGKKIIAIGTAQREDDIYEKFPDDFHSETFKAIVDEDKKQVLEPALFSWDKLMKVKSDMSEKFGERYWLKEYMNAPFTAMGDIIKPYWIQTYTKLPNGLRIFQGWDLSVGKDNNSGDYTVGTTIGIRDVENKKEIYVIDQFVARIDFGERLKQVTNEARKHTPLAIGIESNVFQYDTVSTLQKNTNLPIHPIKTLKNKVEKFRVDLSPHFENLKVFIPENFVELKNELLSLPFGTYDDRSDSLTMAIQTASQFDYEPMIAFS